MKTKINETFLLFNNSNETLSLEKLIQLTRDYKSHLTAVNLKLPEVDILKTMLWAKRTPISFGPYQNLSFFEISNRIYSDLVLLEGAKIIFEKFSVNTIKLNMSNKGGNDMNIIDANGKEIRGEAFNTACSFFKIKLRSELKKFDKGQYGFIAFNKTALDDLNAHYFEGKKNEYPNVKFIVCEI